MLHKFNSLIRIAIVLFLLVPNSASAYHTETQTPYAISISADDTDGKVTVTWQESDGLEDNPPEYYQISYGSTDTADSKTVNTSFGFTTALSNQSYTFTPEQIYSEFGSITKFYAKVKAFHDTNGTTSDWTAIVNVDYNYTYVPPTTAPPTTEAPTTTQAPPPPPPPPTTTTTTLYVVVNDDGTTSEYTESEVKDGTVERDKERKENEDKYGCYMTNAQIDRGDCVIKEEEVKDEELKEEDIIVVDDKEKEPDTEGELPKDDDVVLPVETKDDMVVDDKTEVEIIEAEIKEIVEEIEKTLEIDEPIVIELKDVEEILPENVPENDPEPVVEEVEAPEVIQEVVEIQEVVKVLEAEVITEEQVEQVQEVVDQAIQEVDNLTEDQVEQVATVLQVAPEEVQQIAEQVKTDEAVAEAVEVFVERAVENKDVENYNLADVVTEVQTEQFLADPIGTLIDVDLSNITFESLEMTNTQKEKAQEVVVPVIIASQIVASVQVAPVRMRRRV